MHGAAGLDLPGQHGAAGVSACRHAPGLAGRLLAALLLAGSAGAGEIHWGYGDHDGPEHWHRLHPAFAICGEGREQSPIDLGVVKGELRIPISYSYEPVQLRIARTEHVVDVLNNGHTIQVDYDEGSTIEMDGAAYELVQYHFHAPSEHTLNGLHYPMEMHLVHQSGEGELLVVAVFIREGEHNEAFAPVWEHLPEEIGEAFHLEHVLVNIDDLLPDDRRTLRYTGSLTTPPCKEGVHWVVLSNPVAISRDQIGAFTRIVDGNARPVQARNGREVHEVLPPEAGAAGAPPPEPPAPISDLSD